MSRQALMCFFPLILALIQTEASKSNGIAELADYQPEIEFSRLRRAPNKFESLKRREREQRLIEIGALATVIATDTPNEVRAHVGDTVYLPCRVNHLGTQSINWERDGMVLSIDTFLTTPRPRLSVSHDEDTRTWRLIVKGAQQSDAGVYSCSVRTTPPMKRDVTLHVLPQGVSILQDTPYQTTGLEEIRGNLSALWEEVTYLREEVASHHHGELEERDHDRDVSNLQHEHNLLHRHTDAGANTHHPSHPSHPLHRGHTGLLLLDSVESHDVNSINADQDDLVDGPFDDALPNQRHHNTHRQGTLRRGHQHHPRRQTDVTTAVCHLRPNHAALPSVLLSGRITMTQRKDLAGPVYFELDVQGFGQNRVEPSLYGFHIHETAVTGGHCATAGGHFNPHGTVHGGPTDDLRHVGDLGNIEVPTDGKLSSYILVDHLVAFKGINNIIGRSIVIHSGADDLGGGGDAGSLTNGNAGGRLACCTISMAGGRGRRRRRGGQGVLG